MRKFLQKTIRPLAFFCGSILSLAMTACSDVDGNASGLIYVNALPSDSYMYM